MKQLVLVVVDVRSLHNVGSLFRTCDGLGIENLYLTGITPYPAGQPHDRRLPHVAERATKQIHKTALGAEETVTWQHADDTLQLLTTLKAAGWRLCALEQTPHSQSLTNYAAPDKIALIVGAEVEGLTNEVLAVCEDYVEIPMVGQKESFNVSVAAALGLFWIKTRPQ